MEYCFWVLIGGAIVSITGGALGSDSLCTNRNGICQDDSIVCPGGYVSNHCSGIATRRCCLPSSGDSLCTNRNGICQDDGIDCPGGYVSNHCSGIATRRCCLPSSTGGCSSVNIISRSTWQAKPAKSFSQLNTPVDLFFIHHTAGASCTTVTECSTVLKGIQNYHMNNKDWSDIGYSFLVGEDGNIYEGRGWDRTGAHTYGYNSKSLAASFMGNYMTHLPNDKALNAAKSLIQCGVEKGYMSSDYRLYGHKDVASTQCPGTALYNEIKTWSHYGP